MADLFNFDDLPCSIEAEQALLGCILKQPDCFKDIADKVKADEFYVELNQKIFEVDLLIIDDLGTETMNAAKFSELFNIINTRLLKGKKMVISTNLTTQEIKNLYEERIFSRLVGDFSILRFIGEDIRVLKKKINKA